MKRALLVALLFAGPLWADVTIDTPQPQNKSLMVLTAGGSDAATAGLIWDVYPLQGVEKYESGGALNFTGPIGQYTVTLRAVVWDKKTILTTAKTVVIGESPAPPTPTPPSPTPSPTPTPPQPGPAPIPAEGLRVLFVYETANVPKLPQSQVSVLYSQEIRDYLRAKCATGPDGKTKEFRYWDQHVNTGPEPKLWQDVMARPRTTLPWLVISNGKDGYEGPMPQTIADTMALLKRYGG